LLFVGVALTGYFLTSVFASSMTSSSEPSQGLSKDLGGDVPEPVSPQKDPLTSPSVPAPEEGPEEAIPTDESEATRSYAIALHELPGLPPDAESGTRLEVWAVWRPPITKERQVQRLVSGTRLERIVPPVTPEGPPVAILEVPEKEMSDLLYGDKFGELSAAVVP
jgi:hypothetical protein